MIKKTVQNFAQRLLGFFNAFRSSPGKNPHPLKVISILFIIITLSVAFVFIQRTFQKAEVKELWVDEDWGLNGTAKGFSYKRLVVNGAFGQGSPSPLYYLILKFFDQIKGPLHSLGLHSNIYYRLPSIFYDLASGLAITLIFYFFFKRKNNNYLVLGIQAALLILALFFYYFWKANFFYAIEARPYALWNSLWFLVLTLFILHGEFNYISLLFLTLLGWTATASIFQMFCLALSYAAVQILNKKKISDILRILFKIFAIPTLVCLYYILGKVEVWEYRGTEQYYEQFWSFWTTKEMIPILSVLGIALTMSFKKLRSSSVVLLTVFLLYLASPLINHITLLHGFFFSSRQYIHYELIYPLFLISMAAALPHYLEKLKDVAGH